MSASVRFGSTTAQILSDRHPFINIIRTPKLKVRIKYIISACITDLDTTLQFLAFEPHPLAPRLSHRSGCAWNSFYQSDLG
jgi:hypothetical protein